MNSDKALMIARWVGFIMIVLGWFQVVPLMVGWIGFGIAGISFILESIYKKNLATPKTDDNQEKQAAQMSNDNKDS